jgi:signal transduction histidine kinase
MSRDDNRLGALDEERLRGLLDAGRSLVAEREPEAVFTRLLAVARTLTSAKFAALGVLDEGRNELADFIVAGVDPGLLDVIGHKPRGRGVLGLMISDPKPVRLANAGDHPLSYGFPQGHPAMRSFLGVPVLIRGEAWGNLYLAQKADGLEFTEGDEQVAVMLAAWAAVAIENAKLHQDAARRRSDLERSVRALEATTEIVQAIAGETALERILQMVAKRSRAVVGARRVAIVLLDGGELTISATAGILDDELVGRRVPLVGSLAAEALATGRPVRTAGDARAGADLGVAAADVIVMPLSFGGEDVGVIEAFDRYDGRAFGVEDERALAAAAATVATAIARARLAERDRLRRAQQIAEAERSRWARELHDETLQAFGALRMILSGARRLDEAGLRRGVDQVIDQIAADIATLRTLITELRPAALDDIDLEAAVGALLARARSTYRIEIHADVSLEDGGAALDAERRTIVYRVIQESLTNVGRHAGATAAWVEISARGGEIHIVVRDDGRGFNVNARRDGFGLAGMQERVALADGRLLIDSSERGTRVSVTMPVTTHRAPV